jgi:S-DNA-T family DNA segregation ATPase FtsK/SpoIIIE
MSAKKTQPKNKGRELAGVALQVAWFLLLLALVTYSWRDIPWECSPKNEPPANCIGPVGAYAGWAVFRCFGVAGYLLPALLAAWGVLLIAQSRERLWPRVLWMFGMLAALAVLADMNGAFWARLTEERLHLGAGDGDALNVGGLAGGFAGYVLGRLGLTRWLGPVGSGLVCTGVLVAGLFFVTRTHPSALAAWFREVRESWRERRAERLAEEEAYRKELGRAQAQAAREEAKRAREAEREALRQRREAERTAREEAKRAREEAKRALLAEREEERRAREEERERAAQEKQARREAILARIAAQRAEERRREEEAKAAAEREKAEREKAEQERAEREKAEREKAEREKEAKVAKAAARRRGGRGDAAGQPAPEGEETEPKRWQLPPLTLLQDLPENAGYRAGPEVIEETIRTVKQTLLDFGVEAEVTHVEQGPVVTRYELLPAPGIALQKFHTLAPNLALSLKAESIRVLAPIPGKGVVGLEVPNKKSAPVVLRELVESPAWATTKAALPLALGVDVGGHVLMSDLAALPHLLIAGATGQGKTVCMNSLLAGLLLTRTPDELRLILVDPKIVEFSGYNGLPHLLFPVITESKRVVAALRWAIREMNHRFKMFSEVGARDIKGYNARVTKLQEQAEAEAAERAARQQAAAAEGNLPAPDADAPEGDWDGEEEETEAAPPPPRRKLPYVVIIIDELADLMMSDSQDIEPAIQKLTQLARATGIHMVLATQRPTVNIITGTIKSNVPGRIAFKVAQKNDSRVVIDQDGADKLVGKGDMLVLAGANKLVRAQGAWTKDEEIQGIASFWMQQGRPSYEAVPASKDGDGDGDAAGNDDGGDDDRLVAPPPSMPGMASLDDDGFPDVPEEDDELIQKALDVIRQTQRASTSSIQRRLRIGYTRAARLMDLLEEKGYIGPPRGAEPREILFDLNGEAKHGE